MLLFKLIFKKLCIITFTICAQEAVPPGINTKCVFKFYAPFLKLIPSDDFCKNPKLGLIEFFSVKHRWFSTNL